MCPSVPSETAAAIQSRWPKTRAARSATPRSQDTIGATNNNEVFGFHRGGANLLFGDGSVRWFDNTLSPRILAAMITARDGEVFAMP